MNQPITPPIMHVTQTLCSWSVVECLITIGQGRAAIDPKDPASVGYGVEWMAVASLAPQAALHLYKQLGEFVDSYQRKFGAIPTDPSLGPVSKSGNVIHLSNSVASGSIEEPVEVAPSVDWSAQTAGNIRSGDPWWKRFTTFDPPKDSIEPVVADTTQSTTVDPSGGGQDT